MSKKTKYIFFKRGHTLIAHDERTIDHMAKIADGKYVTVAGVTVPRSVKQLRLFFAILNEVVKSQAEPRTYADAEQLLDAIKISVGHIREVRDLHGNTHFVPASIDFDTLDQVAFQEFFDKAMQLIFERIVPYSPRRDLEQRLCDMLKEIGPAQLERQE